MTVDDEQAFQATYRRCYPAVLAYCARRLPLHDAQDVASDVFATAWRRRAVFSAVEAELPWLYAVAARTIANHRRAGRRRLRLADRAGAMEPSVRVGADTMVVQRSQDEAVMEAVARLRQADREVLMLAGWEGLTASGIATTLGITLAAAEKRLTRAKHRLAAELERPPSATSTRRKVSDERR